MRCTCSPEISPVKLFSSCQGCRGLIESVVPLAEPVCGSCTYQPTTEDRLAEDLRETILSELPPAVIEADALAVTLDQTFSQPAWTLGSAAAAYARHGWPVFPLSTRGKMPAIPKAKGGRGVLDATTDADRVKRWWDKHPTHNIGVATGHNFDVIDVDFRVPGTALRWADIRDIEDFEVDALVSTPHGLHAYVLTTGDSNTANASTGIDFRGKGGYVVAPPSIVDCDKDHGDCEGLYRWWSKPSPRILGNSA